MLHMTTTRKRVLNKSSILAKIEYTLCTFTVSICLTVHVCKYGRIRLSNLHISFFKFDILLFIDYKIILLRLVQISDFKIILPSSTSTLTTTVTKVEFALFLFKDPPTHPDK